MGVYTPVPFADAEEDGGPQLIKVGIATAVNEKAPATNPSEVTSACASRPAPLRKRGPDA